ncbi:MAG: M14 metallopeptidase family protein [Acidobacteriota bacterium]
MPRERSTIIRFGTILFAILYAAAASGQTVPSPESHLGHPVGAEKKLARWDRIVEYMQVVSKGSDRVLYQDVGRSTKDNPFIMLVISSPSNLQRLDHYRQINRRLFDPRTIHSEDEARGLVRDGKVFVLVTCSMHATEVGATQMSMELVHRLATEDSPEVRSILDNVIFLLVPSLNPDGQIMVTDWYNQTLGTPHENAPLPWLYHPYVGHDNNRDAYMFTQKETQLIGRIVFQDWLPQVWLDEHQMGSSGARIFVMPAMDPINPNVDPLIYRNTGLLGFGQAAALEKAGKEGIIYGQMYTYWWEGAMAWAGWWHNMLGMLTEVASARLATTIEQEKADPNQPPRSGAPERGRQPGDGPLPPPTDIQYRSQYPRPWLGGQWSLRDIVDYELIATFGLLETAAGLRTQLLDGLYVVGKRQVEAGRKGNPYAIIVPRDQHDNPTAVKMLQTLAYGGVEVHQARSPFGAGGRQYPEGTFVILMAQPFRAYAKDMLEAQVYPQISPGPGLPARPPYDVAGWSLGMQMGVETIFVNEPFQADFQLLRQIELPPGRVAGSGPAFILSHAANNSLVAVNRLLAKGFGISWLLEPLEIQGRAFGPGAIVVQGGDSLPAAMAEITRTLGIDALAAAAPTVRSMRIRSPRTALYQPWGGNMDEGWTRWLLEQSEFPFVTIHPEDLREGDPSARFDAIIFPDMSDEQIMSGITARNMPEEYKGGIEESGLRALRAFVEKGGTAITLGRSSTLPINKFAVPFRDALSGVPREQFFCPGSIVRVLVDAAHPLGFGMREEADAYFGNSMVLDPVPAFSSVEASVILRYPAGDILRSGWMHGEPQITNKVAAAEVRMGTGRIVLLPLRVQHRVQPHGTFKVFFNAILTSATR